MTRQAADVCGLVVLQWPVQAPRRRFSSRQRTSRYMGVGSSNRKNQWQARILVYGKVTHLGYYETEDEAARWAFPSRVLLPRQNPLGALPWPGSAEQPTWPLRARI